MEVAFDVLCHKHDASDGRRRARRMRDKGDIERWTKVDANIWT
jgi:hypothetical protein